jgi:hypothetical protein
MVSCTVRADERSSQPVVACNQARAVPDDFSHAGIRAEVTSKRPSRVSSKPSAILVEVPRRIAARGRLSLTVSASCAVGLA